MHKRITDYMAYRWRYILGYGFITLVIAAMLTVAALWVPGELRQAELDSAVASGSLGTVAMVPSAVVDLPYHLLQKLGFMLMGVTTLSIKLPSIILGAFTALGIFLLIRTWFKANVAILSTLLITATAQFLFLTQDGTPGIMYVAISVWMLFVATFVTRRKHFGLFWKVLTCIAMALSLYTPMGIYLVLVMLTTALFHPHIRFLIKRFNRVRVAIAIALGVSSLIPLVYAMVVDRSIVTTLLCIPTGELNLANNIHSVLQATFGFFGTSSGHLAQPLYPLGMAILMLVGLVRIFTQRHTARSYITIAWGAVTAIFVVLNPGTITNLFPVAAILVSYGIIYMVHSWYVIFPHNPYARAVGMVPLSVLVLAMVLFGTSRYIGTYHYDPVVMANYSADLTLLHQTLERQHATVDTTQVLASPSELPFYQLVAKYNKHFTVTTGATAKKPLTIATRAAKINGAVPIQVVVNTRTEGANRFYVYK